MQHHTRGQDHESTERPLLCWEAEHMLLWAHGDPKCQAALREGDSQCKSNIYSLPHHLSQIANGLLAAEVSFLRKRNTVLHYRTINKSSQDRLLSGQLLSLQVAVTEGQTACAHWAGSCGIALLDAAMHRGWRNRRAEAGWLFERL